MAFDERPEGSSPLVEVDLASFVGETVRVSVVVDGQIGDTPPDVWRIQDATIETR